MSTNEHIATRERFDSERVAARYAAGKSIRDTWKNRLELRRIESALDGIPPGSRVLDLPTGSGRLLPMLLRRGYQVLAADYSEHMLDQARRHCRAVLGPAYAGRIEFRRLDVMSTGLPNKAFDVVICNRLLHHYPSDAVRQRALAELARIAGRRIIVSYFSNMALSAARFHLRAWLLRRQPSDRVPIWPATMQRDLCSAGLTVQRTLPVRFGCSPQTYLSLRPPG